MDDLLKLSYYWSYINYAFRVKVSRQRYTNTNLMNMSFCAHFLCIISMSYNHVSMISFWYRNWIVKLMAISKYLFGPLDILFVDAVGNLDLLELIWRIPLKSFAQKRKHVVYLIRILKNRNYSFFFFVY